MTQNKGIAIDDCRFVKNRKLARLMLPLALEEIKSYKNPKYQIGGQYAFSAVINIRDFHTLYILSTIMNDDLTVQYGCIVTQLYLPDIKTLNELIKAFTLEDIIRVGILDTFSFLYKTPKKPSVSFQFSEIDYIYSRAEKIIQKKEGERIFNIIKSFRELNGKIHLAYQRERDDNCVEIIYNDDFYAKSDGIIQIDNSRNNFGSFIRNLFKSNNKNNKRYEKLK